MRKKSFKVKVGQDFDVDLRIKEIRIKELQLEYYTKAMIILIVLASFSASILIGIASSDFSAFEKVWASVSHLMSLIAAFYFGKRKRE